MHCIYNGIVVFDLDVLWTYLRMYFWFGYIFHLVWLKDYWLFYKFQWSEFHYFSIFFLQDIIIALIIIKNYFQATSFNFLNFSDWCTSTEMPDQWAIVKICINKTIYDCNCFQVFLYVFWSWPKVFNYIVALEHKFDAPLIKL